MTPDPIAAAVDLYTVKQHEAAAAKAGVFDACAKAIREGRETADTLAARVPFSAVTIRAEARKRGVAPLKTGPKA